VRGDHRADARGVLTISGPRAGKRSTAEAYSALARNTAAHGLASGVAVASEILVFAVLVRLLDAADYGMFIIAAGLAGQFAFLDLGFARALERFLPGFLADGRAGDVPRALTFVLGLHVLVGLLVAALVAGFVLLGGSALLAPDDAPAMARLLWLAALFALPIWTLRCLESALVGLDRMPAQALVHGTTSVGRGVYLAAGALAGLSVETLLIGALAADVIGGCVRLRIVARAVPGTLLVFDAGTRAIGRELFGYSAWLGLQRFVITVSNGFDRMVVSALLGPAVVPVYWICMRVIRIVPGMIGSIGKRAVMPIAAELDGAGREASVPDLVRRGTRVYSAFMAAIVAVLVVHAGPALTLLGGEAVAVWAWACQASLLLMMPVVTRGVLMQASLVRTETARDSALIGMLFAGLHVAILTAGASAGLLGAAILSWSVAHALLAPWWIHRLALHIGLRARSFYGAALRGAWPGALIVLLCAPFIGHLDDASVVVTIIAVGVTTTGAFGAAWFLGLDAPTRRTLLARILGSGDPVA
jgi:O-antigen/teichoic acid export membrane protein